MPTADQLLARLYALRKENENKPDADTYQALHHAFMFISYNMSEFRDYVDKENEKRDKDEGGSRVL